VTAERLGRPDETPRLRPPADRRRVDMRELGSRTRTQQLAIAGLTVLLEL
jgi:hypothetical protein